MDAEQIARFACPSCKGNLQQSTPTELQCHLCGAAFPILGPIPVFHEPEKLASILDAGSQTLDRFHATHARFAEEWQYERQFRQQDDPWGYRSRAAELLKYDWLARHCWLLTEGTSRRIVDLGCGLGFLALNLAGRGARVTALDLSPTAVQRAENSRPIGIGEPVFAAASVAAIPLPSASVDLMVISDGLFTWGFDSASCKRILHNAAATLDKGGKILLMDYLKPSDHAAFLRLANGHPDLKLREIIRLHDRPWYGMELWLTPFRHTRWCRRLLSNRKLAKLLSFFGRILGPFGTAHIAIVLDKSPVSTA